MPNRYNMKRYFLILALALMAVSASAQKVTLNERDEKGIRKIETGLRMFYIDHHMHGCQLSYNETKGKGYYVLNLAFNDQASRWVAKKGQELMMKDEQGNIVTILSTGVSKSSIASNTRGNGASYLCSTMYFLTDEQANAIRNGLVKLRINITYEYSENESLFDVEIPADLTAYLKKAIKNIDKTIPMPVSVDKSVF